MAEADIHVEDMDAFDTAGSNVDGAAGQIRGTSLRSAIASGASGIEGTRIASALERLANLLADDLQSFAADIEHTGILARETGRGYRDIDEQIAGELGRLAR